MHPIGSLWRESDTHSLSSPTWTVNYFLVVVFLYFDLKFQSAICWTSGIGKNEFWSWVSQLMVSRTGYAQDLVWLACGIWLEFIMRGACRAHQLSRLSLSVTWWPGHRVQAVMASTGRYLQSDRACWWPNRTDWFCGHTRLASNTTGFICQNRGPVNQWENKSSVSFVIGCLIIPVIWNRHVRIPALVGSHLHLGFP